MNYTNKKLDFNFEFGELYQIKNKFKTNQYDANIIIGFTNVINYFNTLNNLLSYYRNFYIFDFEAGGNINQVASIGLYEFEFMLLDYFVYPLETIDLKQYLYVLKILTKEGEIIYFTLPNLNEFELCKIIRV